MRETAQSEECIMDMEGEVEIPNPRLWWVRGLGEQPLYQCFVELKSGRNLQSDFGEEMSSNEESGRAYSSIECGEKKSRDKLSECFIWRRW